MRKLFLLLWMLPVIASAQSFDYSTGRDGARAYLRLPRGQQEVKAVLYCHQNMTEEVLFRSPSFTGKMDSLGIAMAFIQRGSQTWDVSDGCQERFEALMRDFAKGTGHQELESAWIIPFGHSAQATFPWNFAAWNPERTLCIISYHGDAPRTNLCGYGRANVEWGRTRNIDRIPGLMVMGEYEWWEARLNPARAFRVMYPDSRISFLRDAGRGHFDLCPQTQDYLARFIEKALQDPRPEGGEEWDGFWYQDAEMAAITKARQEEWEGKAMQEISVWVDGTKLVRNPQSHITMSGRVTGEEFTVTATASTGNTRVTLVSGPAVQTGNNTFRIDRNYFGKDPLRQWKGITLCVEADGNEAYKPGVQELNLLPSVLEESRPRLQAKQLDPSCVRLLPSRFMENQQRDSAWIMSVSAERLLHSFRTTAGVYAGNEGGYMTVKKLGGWESLDCELRGHTTGHVLSACALMYAYTGADCFKAKGDSLVNGLRAVQQALGGGYLSAFPEELVNRNIRGEKVWAPWYTLHKVMAGLLDQYSLAGNELALTEVKEFARWAFEKLSRLDEPTRRRMLRNEFGGMGEMWWNLYGITGDKCHRELAEFFYHNDVIDPLKAQKADFGTKHTNTFIPKVIAEACRYELTGSEESRTAATFFWDQMMAHHVYATGSLSDKEHFFPPDAFKKHITGYTGESCCTYNMLRLARHLYQWEPSTSIMDYYERALYNHILGAQNPETGMASYFLPLAAGTHKVYSTPFNSFWCCVGSSFESNAKYAESIYFGGENTLYVNLFIPSELDWDGFRLRMETAFPSEEEVRFTILSGGKRKLALRKPGWSGKPVVRVNGRRVSVKAGDYLVLDRKWKAGDRVSVTYPMSYRVEPAPQDPSVGVVMYGPLVMALPLGTEGFVAPQPVSDPARYNDYYTYDYHIPASIPAFAPLPESFEGLRPLFSIHEERYAVYWLLNGNDWK